MGTEASALVRCRGRNKIRRQRRALLNDAGGDGE